MRVKSDVFGWRGHEGNMEGATRPDPNRDDRMPRTGWQTQLIERNLGTLTQSHVNRTPEKCLKIKAKGRASEKHVGISGGIRIHLKNRYQKDGGAERVRAA